MFPQHRFGNFGIIVVQRGQLCRAARQLELELELRDTAPSPEHLAVCPALSPDRRHQMVQLTTE